MIIRYKYFGHDEIVEVEEAIISWSFSKDEKNLIYTKAVGTQVDAIVGADGEKIFTDKRMHLIPLAHLEWLTVEDNETDKPKET